MPRKRVSKAKPRAAKSKRRSALMAGKDGPVLALLEENAKLVWSAP